MPLAKYALTNWNPSSVTAYQTALTAHKNKKASVLAVLAAIVLLLED